MTGHNGQRVLEVHDLQVRFGTRRGAAHVVNGISYTLDAGETLAIVGESGSGKSVSSLALIGLVPQPPGRVTGTVRFGERNLVTCSSEELRHVRGNDIAMIFQDPMTSLNPVLTIGRQLTEGMQLHLQLDDRAARRRAIELLDRVGIPSPDRRLGDYPHQFSGGMRQRVMIAIGLACDPVVLIADEPTTALDVTTQAQIVELVDDLRRDTGMGVIWITHDLGVVAGIADRVAVMYAGQIVETAQVDALYEHPRHPYTQGLLGSLPVLGQPERELATIPGLPPDPVHLPSGCPFWPRCPQRLDERCETERPQLRDTGEGNLVATFYEAKPASEAVS
ncbi:MAG: ATP-binding cassette domain-containing protein [Nitriliruptorales bacterium]|nr:ATP-binding cassette domain-containing protein [Nitriliruptorales bacterium]